MQGCLGSRLTLVLGLVVPFAQLVAQAPGTHPNPRYVDSAIAVAHTVGLSSRPGALPLRIEATPRARFGQAAESDEDLLGHIQGVALLPDGGIAVLDDRMARLRLFDPSGVPRQTVGRAGRGPGEFSDALSLTADSEGQLYVGDLTRAIQVFVAGPAGYRFARTIRIDVAPRGMCFIDTLLIVQGIAYRQAEILHVYDRSGRRLRSFGAMYQSSNPLINAEFGVGSIACDAREGLIFYAPRSALGEVRAYRPDGTAVWRIAFGGYRVNRIEDRPRGMSVTTSASGVHSLHSLTFVPGRGVLVQVSFRTPEALREGAEFTTLYSVLLDPATGRPIASGSGLPPILASAQREVALVFDEPAPAFEVRSLRVR